jgi:gliding motility-associated lipoprotein GldH
MRRRDKLFIVTILAGGSLLTACADHTVYHTYRTIPTDGWNAADTLAYEVSIDDSAAVYEMQVEVRHRSDYRYQNLSLELLVDNPQQQRVLTDTLHYLLTGSDGTWAGNGWGGLYNVASEVMPVHFAHTGSYRISITSLMADPQLRGINDVGVRIKKPAT